jgi:hypothetical protein
MGVPKSSAMPRHALATAIAAGWLLLVSNDPDARTPEWRALGSYGSESHCEQGRDAEAEQAATVRIGGALANQPADNPIRQEAFRHAYDRARARYRCVRE